MKIFIYLYGINLNKKLIKIKMNLKKLILRNSMTGKGDNNIHNNSIPRSSYTQSTVDINDSNIRSKNNPKINVPHNISLTNTANNNPLEYNHANNRENNSYSTNNVSSINLSSNNNSSKYSKNNFAKLFNINPNNKFDSDDSSKDDINAEETKHVKGEYGTNPKKKYNNPQGQDFTYNDLNENYTDLFNVNDIYNSQNNNMINRKLKTKEKLRSSCLLNNKRKRSPYIDIPDDDINDNTSYDNPGFKNMSDIKQFQENMMNNHNLNLSEDEDDKVIPMKKKKGWPKGKKRKKKVINDILNARCKCILLRYNKIMNLSLKEKEKLLKIAYDNFKKGTIEYYAVADNRKDTYMFLQYFDTIEINENENKLLKYKDITPEISIIYNISFMLNICTDYSSYYSNYPLNLIGSENSNSSYEIQNENSKNNNNDNDSNYYDNIMENNNNNLYNLMEKPSNDEIKRICIWLYGPSNVGKSYLVNQMFSGNCYYKDLKDNVWRSYNREEVVVVDLPCDFDEKINRNNISILDILSENKIIQAFNNNKSSRIAIYPRYHILIVIANDDIENLFVLFPNYKNKFKSKFKLLELPSKNKQKEVHDSIIEILNKMS